MEKTCKVVWVLVVLLYHFTVPLVPGVLAQMCCICRESSHVPTIVLERNGDMYAIQEH